MTTLKGFQKKHLKGLAHSLKPVVQIGKEGVTEGVIRAVDEGLFQHELIKIKFTDFKDAERGVDRRDRDQNRQRTGRNDRPHGHPL